MLKAIIVDDVKKSRDGISRIIAENNYDVQVVAEASCIKDAELEIKKHQPDIVFLDVEMPDGTGFDLLQKLKPVFFKVIFITAYHEFSIKAFKYSAIDYILKPIDKKDLQDAIHRAKEEVDKESLITKLNSLFSNINATNQLPRKLVLKTAERIFSLDINEIVRCEADKNYTQFFLIDGKKILVSKTMKEYSELLPKPQFFRAHHSHLINMNHFDYFLKTDGGMIIMKDHSKVPLSSRKKDDLIKWIENH